MFRSKAARKKEEVSEPVMNFFSWTLVPLGISLSWTSVILLAVWFQRMDGFSADYSSSKASAYFDMHPLLMGISFVGLLLPGIVSFESFPFSRGTNKQLHGLLHTLAVGVCWWGFFYIYDMNNNRFHTGNFNSPHSILGLLVIILLNINYLGGAFAYGLRLVKPSVAGMLMPIHKRLGLACAIGGVATYAVGFMESYTKAVTASCSAGTTVPAKLTDTPMKNMGSWINFTAVAGLLLLVSSIVSFEGKKDAIPQYAAVSPVEQ